MTLLSICIPTYNREKYLRDTLESIVSQDIFKNTNDVDIVISDNASTDGTRELVEKYLKLYPEKIIYHRNDSNIGFANFEKVLSIADGKFLKLNNDTLLLKPDSLEKMLSYIKNNLEEKNILFFSNNASNIGGGAILYSDLNSFIKDISYYTTWIGSFGIWKSDFEKVIKIFNEKTWTEIPHTYILFNFLENHRNILCISEELFESVCPQKKGGNYNVAQVFGENYINFLNEFRDKNLLSTAVYNKEKYKLIKFINKYYFDVRNKYNFQKTGYFKYLLKFYRWDLYFYLCYIKMGLKYVLRYL